MKNFNEVYQRLYTEKNEELEKLRKQKVNRLLVLIVVMILVVVIALKTMSPFVMPIVFFIFLMSIIIYVRIDTKSNYVKIFKKDIIEPFVKNCDTNLKFCPDRGISASAYLQAEFEGFDYYYSEDLIEGILDEKYATRMAEVKTEDESTDEDGHTTRTTLFYGIFGQVECAKNLPGVIKIRSDKGVFGKLFQSKDKIEMDSSEFEKHFDVSGTNPIIVMQILTADIMEMLVEFKEKHKIKYELTIKHGMIYIRFHTGGVFEPKLFGKSLDYDTLKRYYDIIDFIFNVSRKINRVIEETEF